jgi:hypothetical protein
MAARCKSKKLRQTNAQQTCLAQHLSGFMSHPQIINHCNLQA